jgi:phosphate transport system protein
MCRSLRWSSPGPEDLRAVVAALRAVGHLKRMGNLAQHIADIARLKHPNPMIAGEVRPVLARKQAVDAALIGRYYERFADHAAAVAAEVRYLAIRRIPKPHGSGTGSRLR